MGLLLDTSLLIEIERTGLGLPRGEDIGMAAVTVSELLQGVHRARGPRQALRQVRVEALIERVPTIPFTLEIARLHARLWSDLAARRRTIGAHDLQIGATALVLGWDVA